MERRKVGALSVSALFAVASLAAPGCGSAPPTSSQAEAIASIRAAEAVGAESAPDAAAHLELARDQLRLADDLIDQERMEEAERTLVRAKADAELATALAREAEAREQAERLRRDIEALERAKQ